MTILSEDRVQNQSRRRTIPPPTRKQPVNLGGAKHVRLPNLYKLFTPISYQLWSIDAVEYSQNMHEQVIARLIARHGFDHENAVAVWEEYLLYL